jgi:peptide/nickel transport system permease protein
MTKKGMGVVRRLFLKSRVGLCGSIVIVALCLTAFLAPILAPFDPYEMHSKDMLQPPSRKYLLGTDHYGRDVLSRVIYGSRISLYVGVVSVTIALAIGVPLGLIAGYYKRLDNFIMRVMDILFSFPPILLAIVVVAVLGPSLTNAMLAIGITTIPRFARFARAQALSVVKMDYVQAAVAVGASSLRIIFHHVLKNSAAIILVQISVNLAVAIVAEAALSFLGLGTQPPEASWGIMLNQARMFIELAPWLSIYPGLAIMIAVLGFNLLGDGLRDVLDPTLRGY